MRVAVVGPTATGKSDLGLALAAALGGEVVNADAMQLYRGMDIGTAKLRPAERRGIAHHQLDVLDVTQDATVAAYQRHARADLDAIEGRGRTGVVVGGSGLYLRALLDVLELAPTDPAVRARLEAEVTTLGPGLLHDRLAALDPDAAAAIDRANARRVVRALEVVELTGGYTAHLPEPAAVAPTVQIGLDLAVEELDRRIEARVDRMWAAGLVEEVAALAPALGRTAVRAVGYAQVLPLLRGEVDEAGAREATVRATRRLARKQRTWFRRDPRVVWFDATDPDLVDRALDLVGDRTAGAGRTAAP